MAYCLNPRCPQPENDDQNRFCIQCGSQLLLGDRYRALKPIGQEGRGRTFLAVNQAVVDQPRCILKQVTLRGSDRPRALAEFRRDAGKLQLLGQHANIPELLAYIESDNHIHNFSPILVQELIEGEDLENADGDENAIIQLLNEVLPILHFIHEHEVIHRDINPQNLIRTVQDQLFLVDFSTLKVTTKTALARTGTVVGSAAYAAPEQLRGKAVATSDLYSLAVVCIHLLTRLHPFDLYSSLEGVWVWEDYLTTTIGDRLAHILNQMLAEAVRDRYPSAAAVYAELNAGKTLQVGKPNPTSRLETLIPGWHCTATLTGHTSTVQAIAFHPQQPYLASASADRTAKVWQLAPPKLMRTLSGHRSIVTVLLAHPNGQWLLTGSWDYTIRLWEGKAELAKLEAHSGWVQSLALAPDGKLLASGSADRSIVFWDLETQAAIVSLTEHEGTVSSLVIDPSGQWLASGSADKTVLLWNLPRQRVVRRLTTHEGTVTALAFSPSGKILFSASEDSSICVWDLAGDRLLQRLDAHLGGVQAIAVSQRGNLLVSSGVDQTVKLWHPGSGQLLATLTEHEGEVGAVAISPDGQTIASGSQDKTIKLWQFQ
ncbi:MAG: protein kinase [Spirulinaceae cyanobacterium RM2_2_10]|nr:protein kinase [Spirulinaceae cyanobacterium SM2_1_0]NJO19568.1 protein kinase [Spirulinaceae cyanobacterium RM2_2_10]